jgi:hypothetical protein
VIFTVHRHPSSKFYDKMLPRSVTELTPLVEAIKETLFYHVASIALRIRKKSVTSTRPSLVGKIGEQAVVVRYQRSSVTEGTRPVKKKEAVLAAFRTPWLY